MIKNIYAGTYTEGASEGIYKFVLQDGIPLKAALFCRIADPKYICHDDDYLYSLGSFEGRAGICKISKEGQIIDTLTFEKIVSCYISCDEDNIYTANYHEGSLAIIDKKTFTLKKHLVIKDQGGCHQVLVYQNRLIVPFLKMDRVFIFTKEGEPVREITFPEGSGPRHGILSPDGRYLYLVSELSNELFVLETANWQILKKTAILADGVTGKQGTAAIRADSDGRYLYISTRGENVISVVETDGEEVRLREVCDCGGDHPRDILVVDDVLLVANRFSREVSSFPLEDGLIKEKTGTIFVPEAVSLSEW